MSGVPMKYAEIESTIARHLRELIQAHASNDRAAIDQISVELGSALEYLLPFCIEADAGTDWKYWCDGVILQDMTFNSPTEVTLVGIAIYGPNGSEWMAPLEAEFTLGIAEDSLRIYRIRFGEKANDGGIARTAYTQSAPVRDRLVRRRPRESGDWWFTHDESR
jgi:hypothetical protein